MHTAPSPSWPVPVTPDVARSARGRVCTDAARALGPLAAVLLCLVGCSKNPVAVHETVPVDSLILSPASATMLIGGSQSFSVAAYDTAGALIAAPAIVWRSSNRGVFTVQGSGLATGVGEGTALLIASAGSASDTATITVMPAAHGWYIQDSRANGAHLNGVFFQPDGRTGWAVGEGGRILMTTDAGVNWNPSISQTSFTLNAVWFTGALEGWVVGAGGTVLRTGDGGDSWSRVSAGASENLMDVVFTHPDSGYAVGASGVVLRTQDGGLSWQRLHPTTWTLRGVAFAGRDGWAVGDAGTILGTHDGGASWFTLAQPVTSLSLHSVRRRSSQVAFAAGVQGVTPRTVAGADSTEWQLGSAGASNQLEGISFPTDVLGFAVGFNGTGAVLRTDDSGVTWQSQVSHASYRLNDVFCVDSLRAWAVGDNGTIIHTVTGGHP